MQIEMNHGLQKDDAIKRIDGLLDDLIKKEFPGNVKIMQSEKTWNDNHMNFSFKAKNGLLSKSMEGKVIVTETSVIVESKIPSIVKSFISEEKITETIRTHLGSLFSNKPTHADLT